jgi:Ca2+-transporting ATPase
MTAEETTQSTDKESPNSPVSPNQVAVGIAAPATNDKTDKASELFPIPIVQFQKLVDPKSKRTLESMGGLDRLYEALRSDPTAGLSVDERFQTQLEEQTLVTQPAAKFIERTAAYGRNVLPVERQKNIFELMWIAMHDNTLILLTVVSLVSLAVGLYKDLTQSSKPGYDGPYWVEGCAIIIAVVIVLLVQSFNDYQKESQFRKLNAKKEDRMVRGIRNGQNVMISIFEVQVWNDVWGCVRLRV